MNTDETKHLNRMISGMKESYDRMYQDYKVIEGKLVEQETKLNALLAERELVLEVLATGPWHACIVPNCRCAVENRKKILDILEPETPPAATRD